MRVNDRHSAPSKSSVVKRSIMVAGTRTAISLERPFWDALKEIAAVKQLPASRLVEEINRGRTHLNLSSAVRLYVLAYYMSAPTD